MPKKISPDKNIAIDYLNRDIENIKLELQLLNKVVKDGNGQPSLVQQVTALTINLNHLQHEMAVAIDDLKQTMCNHHKAATTNNRMNWQFKMGVIVAVISSISTLIMHFYK
jgi:hypothetical protein